jgi:hypothetical protein
MIFHNIKLYLADPATGLLRVRYICADCGIEMEMPYYHETPCTVAGVPCYDEASYLCEDCYMERMETINEIVSSAIDASEEDDDFC